MSTQDPFETLKTAMQDEPDFAHAWHCNVAMACYDAILAEDEPDVATGTISIADAHEVSNDAATRFMKLCFDVETAA